MVQTRKRKETQDSPDNAVEKADEALWQAQFAASKEKLKALSAAARQERERGETVPLETILEAER